MRLKVALLTMTAALVMTMGMTGCTTRDNVTTKSARPNNMYRSTDGVRPLDGDYRFNANRYNTNFTGNGYRTNTLDNNLSGTYGTHGNYDGMYGHGRSYDGMHGRNYDGMHSRNYDGMHGRNYDMSGGRYGMHSANSKMEMSQKIANKIATIKGVKSANVVVTNNNAYVAVTTEHTTTAPKGKMSGMSTHRQDGRTYGTSKHGSHMGTYGTSKHGSHMGTHGTSKHGSRSHMGTQGTSKHGSHAGSYGTRSTSASDVPTDLKEKIGNMVKKEAPNCNNVYVSANPDFVDRMNYYNNYAANGQPLTGFANEFQEMIYRIFPTNAGANPTGQPTRLNNMAPGR
ncbi:YhcN/YlaJ family sporulation lipoprotein [Paenibacillus profundus]|uniref:YhcN/YlaJ family sporulation lipoprotein n=1 Tax=Paenibacillus profundus TaxID=1173085 RepID=A0ABS8YKW4_9BACL|nr:YhcN/YlaJ family sporulation lipoprotein [Paenibacillus profundus]MCE5170184.1 YhcN/YlaJ family sporulation lipoprotein [Paenibacillus profundus]